MDRDDPAFAGQKDYSRALLNLYDPLVLGPIARFVWRCPTSGLLERYQRHIRPNHLDVGPGTGYFLEHSGLPAGSAVTILDPNRNVLRHVTRRLRQFDVTAIEADVLKPLPAAAAGTNAVAGPYDSAALHLVIHCLPGPMSRKAAAVANVATTLAPSGVLFGASVIGSSGRHNWIARRFLGAFNRQGAFDNFADSESGLRDILGASFEDVDLETIGSIALFAATGPRGAWPEDGGSR